MQGWATAVAFNFHVTDSVIWLKGYSPVHFAEIDSGGIQKASEGVGRRMPRAILGPLQGVRLRNVHGMTFALAAVTHEACPLQPWA